MAMLPPKPVTKPKEAAESEPPKPKIVSAAFISSGPKKAAKKRPAAAPTPPPSGSCRKYWSVGRCEFGDSCKYKHSANPDVPPQAPAPAGACKKFWADGHCDFGDNCKYPHVDNPDIDPATVPESGGLTLKKAMKMGGRALNLSQWMDPKKMESFCAAPPSDSVVFHGEVRGSSGSNLAVDGVDMPSEDIEAELAALQRLVAPQVLAKVQRQLQEESAAATTVAAVHTCTCHLMPGFNAQTGTKLVLCFNCNNAAIAEKRQAVVAAMMPQSSGTEVVSTLAPVPEEEDAPGEERQSEGMVAMAALLDKIDGARASSLSTEQVTETWQEWEKFQQECGFNLQPEE